MAFELSRNDFGGFRMRPDRLTRRASFIAIGGTSLLMWAAIIILAQYFFA